jgi:hypothetical protein
MLKLLQPGCQPLGQFDGYDQDFLTLKGGEVVTFISVAATSATDKAAADSFDGYVDPSSVVKRPVVTHTYSGSAASNSSRPLMLADDGTTGYGTLFGTVVGGTVGQITTGGAVLGPHTATGSGKVTCWEKPGLYAVSLDACDTASNGLVPTNTTLDVGYALTYTSTGLLTPASTGNGLGGAPTVARFVEFESNGSLVNTPNRLVAALNSPSGIVSSVGLRSFAFATFYFAPPLT